MKIPCPIDILLVEDNQGDIELTQEAFSNSTIRNRIHVVGDGARAIDFLRRRPPYENAPLPNVILLNLGAPHTNGQDMLELVKNDSELRQIPTVVLISSDAEKDIVRRYRLHANCCIGKPVDLERFLEIVRAIEDFWLSIARLPEAKKVG